MGNKQRSPVWKGPEKDGVTFSLLSRFLVCRERFRLYVVEGIRPEEGFNHRLEYGNMWHICEEALAKEQPGRGWAWERAVASSLGEFCKCLCERYPTAQEQVDHWYRVCREQFPLYVEFWSEHPDVTDRTPLLQEQVFDTPYTLPSGRVVRLRGKWDSVDLIGKGKAAGVYLQENKTKGDVRPEQIQAQLHFDLQTMLYLIALHTADERARSDWDDESVGSYYSLPARLCGVRYNVVRRPLSGGKGTIVRHKGSKNVPSESKEAFYERLARYIKEEPEYYFMRFNVEVTPDDVRRFRRECLDPVLEQLCDWWEWVSFITVQNGDVWDNDVQFAGRPDLGDNGGGHSSAVHWRHPFGVWNPLNEGGATDVDEYLYSGSEMGLTRVDNLFPELGGD